MSPARVTKRPLAERTRGHRRSAARDGAPCLELGARYERGELLQMFELCVQRLCSSVERLDRPGLLAELGAQERGHLDLLDNPPVLLLEFLEQHRGKEMVADRLRLSRFVIHHEVGQDLGYLLGDQTVLAGAAIGMSSVTERDGSKPEQRVAPHPQFLNVALHPLGGGNRPELRA